MTNRVDPIDVHAEEQRMAVAACDVIFDVMDRTGLTQSDLADRIGTSESYVSQVLHGSRNMTLHTMAKLALGCGFKWDLVMLETKRASADVFFRDSDFDCYTAIVCNEPFAHDAAAAPETPGPLAATAVA